nr:Photosystem II reaction center protein T [Cutleria multifida]WAM62561.1 Photosystem II reaction center protein T [Cutleria multifida]
MAIDFSQLSQPALVYSTLLIGTLMVLFFAVFFRDPPKILKG